jgi:hypothetical protein
MRNNTLLENPKSLSPHFGKGIVLTIPSPKNAGEKGF